MRLCLRVVLVAAVASASLLGPVTGAAAESGTARHALAMHGEPKYPADFTRFDYVEPKAPVGGELRLASIGTYDSLNPYILKGVVADGAGLLFETLMTSSDDEAFTEYGLIAESIEVPEDRSWVVFKLRDEARFHDRSPITVEDVIFSFNLLREQGQPFYRAYYASVASVEDLGDKRVKFTFVPGANRELPLIVGQLPVLSKAYYTTHPFDQTTLVPPIGSGPYLVESLDPGRSIRYRRNPDYWGWALAVNAGRWNFEHIGYDYYRDPTVALEAFKAHEYDVRLENSAKAWAAAYQGPALASGLIIQEAIDNELPTGMQGFAFNLRRPKFADPRLREALSDAFDFEWMNATLFYGAYTRTESYFSNSELAARGLPSAAELALLEPFRAELPPEVFTEAFEAPVSDGSGNNRPNLRKAAELLKEAGFRIAGNTLLDPRTGEPVSFEFLLASSDFERVVLPFIQNLKKLGIAATVRTVDTPQYQERLDQFDFDIVVANFGQSLSPGNEQREFWGSAYADMPGSRNLIGIENPVVDALIEAIIAAPERESLIAATRALDRVLLRNHYVIPQWHIRSFRVAYWNEFARPAVQPPYGLGLIDRWWVDAAKATALDAGARSLDQD
ncbi:MAG TPA: extracellular solute-binding protein [Alphaproteobacteria bacterium]|nr:extracellular solute-binding protein [Alphaproteobacteria bacterium]